MGEFFALTPGQGSALSGLLAACGAVLAVWLGAKSFAGKVKTLRDAVEQSQTLFEGHVTMITQRLTEVSDQLSALDMQTSGFQSGLGRIEANTAAISEQADTELAEAVEDGELVERGGQEEEGGQTDWGLLKSAWLAIRDELEARASSDDIDGRTRASFSRVDRRSYWELLDKMRRAEVVGVRDFDRFGEALDIWMRHKSGRAGIDGETLARLTELQARLVHAE